jgi:hypothetical protein
VGPQDKIIMDGVKERQGDFVFTASETGEYRFCFNNQMSTFAEKFVDFEIAVCFPSPSFSPFSFTLPLGTVLLIFEENRSRTNNAPQYPPNKAHPPNKPPR